MRNIIVTGGAGFLGSHLIDRLTKLGNNVVSIDNLFRGNLKNISNVSNWNIDLSYYTASLENALKTFAPDYVFHLAAINGTMHFYDNAHETLRVNSTVTSNLIQALSLLPKKPKVIYTSTSEVYNEPLNLPSLETDITYLRINEIRDSYAAGKLLGEFQLKLGCEKYKMPWTIARLFNSYGPRMVGTKYGQVIPEFITRILDGEYPLKIAGDGSHRRSFCYIKDTVDMLINMVDERTNSEIFNLGNTLEISIAELGWRIMCLMEKEARFEHLPERSGDHKRRQPDISKYEKMFGNKDFVSLNDGLLNTIEYYKGLRT